MNVKPSLLVLPILMLAAACGGDDTGGVASDPVVETSPSPTVTEAPATMPMAGGMSAAMNAPFQPVGGSNVAGEATISPRGQQSEVMVRLTGATASTEHPGHVHSGRCDAIGGVVQPLDRVATDGSGAGTATTTLDIPAMTLMNGQHIVVYHGAGGAPIACAEIPSHM
jgi:hypothetical protein